jgi:hypothetical protein
MKIVLITLLIVFCAPAFAKTPIPKSESQFIPFNPKSSIGVKKRDEMLAIFSVMSQKDEVLLKKINLKYRGFVDVEKAKGTPVESRGVYNTIRLAQFDEIVERLSPEVVSAIMRTKKNL